MDRTSDFGSDSEGSNPSAVTFAPLSGLFYCLKFQTDYIRKFVYRLSNLYC